VDWLGSVEQAREVGVVRVADAAMRLLGVLALERNTSPLPVV